MSDCRLPVYGRGGVLLTHTLIDADDFEALADSTWKLLPNGYVFRSVPVDGVWRTEQLHRVILGLQRGDGKVSDHINRDRLDNRRANLRVVTPAQNAQNLSASAASASKYRGVYRSRERWEACVKLRGKRHNLGSFPTELDAGAAAAQWRAANMTHSVEDASLLAHDVRRGYARRNGKRGLTAEQVEAIRKLYLAGESSRTLIARRLSLTLGGVRNALCPNGYKDAPLFAEMMAARRQRGDAGDEYLGVRKGRRAKAEAGTLKLEEKGDHRQAAVAA